MGGIVLGILVWQEGGEPVLALIVLGLAALAGLAYWLVRRARSGKPHLLDPGLFKSATFRVGISQQLMQQIALGGLMIALPIYLQMVLEYSAMLAGLSLAPLSLSMFAVALYAGKKAGKRRPANIVGLRVPAGHHRGRHPDPDRAPGRLRLGPAGPAGDRRQRTRPAGVPTQRLHPLADLGGAGERGRRGELGGRLVRPVVRAGLRRRDHAGHAVLSFTNKAEASDVLSPAQQTQVARTLETNAEVMTNTHLDELLATENRRLRAEIIRINTEARPVSLQIALLIPLLAALLGLLNSVRMRRLPDPKPSNTDGVVLG